MRDSGCAVGGIEQEVGLNGVSRWGWVGRGIGVAPSGIGLGIG